MKKNKKRDTIFKLGIYTITMILTIIYIIFRIFYTLPIHFGIITLIIGIFVLLLEIFETIDFTIYYMNILWHSKKSPNIPKIKKTEYPDVDVLIATINEKEELLEDTIKACLKMKYPNKKKIHIYLCDDGNRKEIKKLAKKHKINYITRNNNKNAKAGNYNNALKNTSSPYIATFDADMKPTPDFLLKTIPFFIKEEKVGFVQLPQSFINPDIFQLRFGVSNLIPFEQDYFYHRIQLAKNNINSTIYCGTNAILSREALNETNGFALNTITEDFATGLLIESKGYKGIALSDIEAYGDSVNDLEAFAKQRSRWARGCIQTLKNHKIIRNKGLTIRQKLDYLASVFYWFFGIRRIIYLIIPLLFSLFGIMIIDCNLVLFLYLFIPQYFMKRIVLDLVEDNRRSATWNKIYEIILSPILAKEVLKELFGFGNTKFEVTPKEKISFKMTKTNKKLLIIHSVLLLFSILGLLLSIYKISLLAFSVYLVPLAWIATNIIYLIVAIRFDLGIKPVDYNNFKPNNMKYYDFKSFFEIFISVFKKKIKNESEVEEI